MQSQGFIQSAIGFVIIILGLIAYHYPILYSGYNTMSAEDKRNFDIDSYKREMRIFSVIFGILTFIIGLLEIIGINIGNVPFFITIVLFAILSIVRGNHYSKRDKRTGSTINNLLLSGIILVIVGVIIYQTTRPSTLEYTSEQVKISGSYGVEFSTSSIDTLVWHSTLPSIALRTNGTSIGTILQGNFRLKNGEKAKLYIQDKNLPSFSIRLKNGSLYYYNTKDSTTTKNLYLQLQAKEKELQDK